MDTMLILGDGGLGRAVETAARDRMTLDRGGHGNRGRGGPTHVDVLGRPPSGTHDPARLAGADLVVEASRGDAVVANMTAALEAGCRRFVIATTGWAEDRPAVERAMRPRRDGGGRLELQPRRGTVRASRGDGRRALRAPRRLRPIPPGMASAREARPRGKNSI